MLDLAERGRGASLRRLIAARTCAVPSPSEGTFAVFFRPKLGVVVCVDRGLLYIDERLGVCWSSLLAIRPALTRLTWRNWK